MFLATYQASQKSPPVSFFIFFNGAHYFLEELKLELFFFGGWTCLMLPRVAWTGYGLITGDELI